MTIGEQLKALQAALVDWAAENTAQVGVASDRGEFLAQIAENPTGLPVVFMFQAERMNEAEAPALIVWRTFAAVIARQHGWTAVRKENLTTDGPVGVVTSASRKAAQPGDQGEPSGPHASVGHDAGNRQPLAGAKFFLC